MQIIRGLAWQLGRATCDYGAPGTTTGNLLILFNYNQSVTSQGREAKSTPDQQTSAPAPPVMGMGRTTGSRRAMGETLPLADETKGPSGGQAIRPGEQASSTGSKHWAGAGLVLAAAFFPCFFFPFSFCPSPTPGRALAALLVA